LAFVIATTQLELVPEQAPLHPLNVAPALGVAVRVTVAPAACGSLQPPPPRLVQERPAPEMVPLPVTCPLRMYVVSPPANSASTALVVFIVSVQDVDVNAEQSPPQSWKSALLPEAATALSVTVEFAATLVEHPSPPAAVQWSPVLPAELTT
jgi:hypothetical protein